MTRRDLIALALALIFILCGIYWLTYNGLHISNDERFLFDSTESFVRRGDFRLTYLFDLRSQRNLVNGVPWPEAAQEPLQPILASPLFWLAQSLPKIGLMHTVWIFNIGVTALTAVVIFGAGLLQGYRPWVAWMGGLLFGVGTMAWPYSRTFFREPLMMFFTLVCFVAAWRVQKIWQDDRLPWHEGVVLVVSFGGAFLTKAASLVLLPGLVIVILPSLNVSATSRNRRQMLVAGGIVLLLGVVIAIILTVVSISGAASNRFAFDRWTGNLTEFQWKYVFESLIGYQVSPARSIWLFSPLLVMGFVGAVMLIRRGEWRFVAGSAVALVMLGTSYGVTLFVEWWGGHSWGPRYLLPLVPVLMLWTLPVLEKLFGNGMALRWRVIAYGIILVSIGVQVPGIWVAVPRYYQHLGENGVVVEKAGLWSWKWSPLAQHLQLLDVKTPDVAWHFSLHSPYVTMMLSVVLVIIASAWAGWIWRRAQRTQDTPTLHQGIRRYANTLVALALFVLLLAALGSGLYQLRDDPRYTLNNPDALAMVDILNAQAQPDEAVFIEENNFQLVMMNYLKHPKLVVSLPLAPGENFNPAITAQYAELPLEAQLGIGTPLVIDWVAERYPGLWVVLGKNFAIPNVLRPTERYLVTHYFPVTRIRISDLAIVVHFYALDAPFGPPTIQEPVQFGDQLTLIGFDLPEGTDFQRGEIVPLSLAWTPVEPLVTDYLVSVQIAPHNAAPVVQIDGLPQATFGYTSRWTPDETYRDNYGLQLPDDLAAGSYDLQVIVYSYPDFVRLPILNGNGESLTDVAILRVITVH